MPANLRCRPKLVMLPRIKSLNSVLIVRWVYGFFQTLTGHPPCIFFLLSASTIKMHGRGYLACKNLFMIHKLFRFRFNITVIADRRKFRGKVATITWSLTDQPLLRTAVHLTSERLLLHHTPLEGRTSAAFYYTYTARLKYTNDGNSEGAYGLHGASWELLTLTSKYGVL